MRNPLLLVIVGPTASGKTKLAIDLARKYNGEIICADSRTVYKGLDIGTAKPTEQERRIVRHHLLDVVAPNESFTVSDFKRLAISAIADIAARGKLPILTGGSGLYVDAVLYDYGFSDDGVRDGTNPRHAHPGSLHTKSSLRDNTIIVGLMVDRDVLKQRIVQRVESMVDAGLAQEIKWLLAEFPETKALQSPGYKAFREYVLGSQSLQQAKEKFASNDYQLSRRQMTWFRRNKSIHWVENPSKADDFVTTFLNKKQ
jgi:tRNA dimethylallyltransferase